MAFLLQFLTIKKNIGSNFFKFARGDFPHSVEQARSVSLTYPVAVQQETATAR